MTTKKKSGGTGLKCPNCNQAGFKTIGELGLHRRAIHKLSGSTRLALAKAGEGESIADVGGSFKCPECLREFKNGAGLGIHRRHRHGVLGQSTTALSNRGRRTELEDVTEYNAQTSATHIWKNTSREGLLPKAQASADPGRPPIAETTLALAFGRFQEFLRHFAGEHDLPPKQFAREFLELVHASTIR